MFAAPNGWVKKALVRDGYDSFVRLPTGHPAARFLVSLAVKLCPSGRTISGRILSETGSGKSVSAVSSSPFRPGPSRHQPGV